MKPPSRGASRQDIDRFVAWAISELSLQEKVDMMSGQGFLEAYVEDNCEYNIRPYQTGGGNERLGLPALWFSDGPRGVASNHSTSFPVAIARGASWDVDLEERVGDAIGIELRALGANFYGAPCINLLRHPAWGRAQETYGEDPYHLGEMGAALVRGVQRHNVIATAKHFAANSIENSRFKVDVQMDENVLRAVYLPHFRRVVDEGVASIMSAYNKVNGEYCGHNARLLHDILKNEWGFEGFVHSDFVKGIYGPEAVVCGLDIENPMPIHFGQTLIDAVADRRVGQNDIDEAVCRILTTIYRFQTRPDPQEYPKTLVASQQHRDLAREVAEKSAVLLRNQGSPQPLLPLDRDAIGRLAVIGALADQDNQGDMGSSRVRPPSVVTPLAGLQAYLENSVDIVFEDGNNLPRAAAAAAAADVAVIVVGLTPDDEGEFIPGDMTLGEVDDDTGPGTDSNVENPGGSGGDRDRLTLGEKQEALVCAVAEANPNTIVVLVGGSAIILERWHRQVSAILMLWYPGMEGGSALARLLFGDANPSGKLPFTIPRHPDDLPFFDKNADSIRYDLHHGYTLLDRDGVEPAYPFGFGLGYSRFAYTDTQIDIDGEHVFALTTVANRGVRDGREVVQVYARPVSDSSANTRTLLCGFGVVQVVAGGLEAVRLPVPTAAILMSDPAFHCLQVNALQDDVLQKSAVAEGTDADATAGGREFYVWASGVHTTLPPRGAARVTLSVNAAVGTT